MSSDTDPVLRLGRELADALDPSDVVGRWMSHHLAELIKRSEANPDDEELASTTREVVLKLWERKRGAPFRAEPYGYVRPVLRAIARLDSDPNPWAHYRPFGEQEPNAGELTTYPLLETACDIDREVGQLIRLAIAVAAREATSREEPWVAVGLELADTEEDRALRALDQLVRRLQLKVGPDAREALPIDSPHTSESGSVHSAAASADDVGTEGAATARANLKALADRSELGDALSVALGIAVVRCRRLIDQFADLCAERVVPEDGERTGPPVSAQGERPGH